MTLFACPSPTGGNKMGLYLDGDGRLCDRFGRSWSSQKLAMDEMPDLDDLEERASETEAAENKIKNFVNAIEPLLNKVDPRWAKLFWKKLDEHGLSSRARIENSTPEAKGVEGATDEEDILQGTEKYSRLATMLLQKGMSQDDVPEALRRAGCSSDLARKVVRDCEAHSDRDGSDRIPVSGLPSEGGMGGYLSGVSKSKHGAHEMASDSFTEMFPGAERLRPVDRDFSHGEANARKELAEDIRRQPRQKRRMAYDARAAARYSGSDFTDLFPGAARLRPTSM